jgi:pyridoxal 5'-phosphate synthase pdxT subunit
VRPIGVLALQGGFEAHAIALREIGHEVRWVRTREDLDCVDGLVLPGGESTVQWKLLENGMLIEAIRAFATSARPILATCAGLILAARAIVSSNGQAASAASQSTLGIVDVDVARNAYGRQLDSFEGHDDAGELELVFIRAPRITRVGSDVRILATLSKEPILVREGAIVAAAFHPELTGDRALHRLAFGNGC